MRSRATIRLTPTLLGAWAALPVFVLFQPALTEADTSGRDISRYRTNTIDTRVRRVPSDVQEALARVPERYVGPLTESLLSGVDDPFLKTKILHDWIAENIDYDVYSYLSGNTASSSWENTLRRGKGVCHGYAELMKTLCTEAGIPCERISGYGRGFGFRPGTAEDLDRVNHAWNAVYLDGRWYPVDVTWDAGHVHGSTYQKRYSTAYLFLDPQLFIHTHLPAEAKWQLLSPPRSRQQFANLPYLNGRFFEYRLQLLTGLRSVNRMRKSVEFAIGVHPNVRITTTLADEEGNKLPGRTLVQHDGGRATVLATFPGPGRWLVHLHAKQHDDPGSYWRAGSFVFDASEGTNRTFAETYGKYHTLGASLQSPLYLPIRTDQPVEFRIRVRRAEEVNLVVGNKWRRMTEAAGANGVFHTTAAVGPGARVVLTAKMPGDPTHHTLLNFATP